MKNIKDITLDDGTELLKAALEGIHIMRAEPIDKINVGDYGDEIWIRESNKINGKWFVLHIQINEKRTFIYSRLLLWDDNEYQMNQLALINKLKELNYI